MWRRTLNLTYKRGLRQHLQQTRAAWHSTATRTRFAPSPTGAMHLGGLRTALYCYLLAKKGQKQESDGKSAFILRVEDTDQARTVEGATEQIHEALDWLTIKPDEGPPRSVATPEVTAAATATASFVQSERLKMGVYDRYIDELVQHDHAYACFCSSERLDRVRALQAKRGQVQMYDRMCSTIDPAEAQERMKSEPYVIRQRIPLTGETKVQDIVRGKIGFPNKQLDDSVLLKSDGFPSYHLCNVVDDHIMEISHVIRGEEWLPSLPKHVLLYEAFGWTPPEFAHLPLLLEASGKKLSKRGRDAMVVSHFTQGDAAVLPAAMVNFLALLGWHPGSGNTQEVFDMDELTSLFTLKRVQKGGAVVNLAKLGWFNTQHWNQIVDQYHELLLAAEKEGVDPNITEADAVKVLEPLLALVLQPTLQAYSMEDTEESRRKIQKLVTVFRTVENTGSFIKQAEVFCVENRAIWSRSRQNVDDIKQELQDLGLAERGLTVTTLGEINAYLLQNLPADFETKKDAFQWLKALAKKPGLDQLPMKTLMLAVRYLTTRQTNGVAMGETLAILGTKTIGTRLYRFLTVTN